MECEPTESQTQMKKKIFQVYKLKGTSKIHLVIIKAGRTACLLHTLESFFWKETFFTKYYDEHWKKD